MSAMSKLSWVFVHILVSLSLVAIISIAWFGLQAGEKEIVSFPFPVVARVLVGIGMVAMLWLWVRMLIDYFRERPPQHSIFWGFFLFMGAYIGAIFYFF